MRKFLSLFVVMKFCFFAPVIADEQSLMEGYYGNTWEYIGYDGTKYLQIDPDFTFEMLHFDNRVFQGTWRLNDKKVCFKIGEEDSCFGDITGYMAGQKWEGMHHTGNPYTGIIHAGRIPMLELQKQKQAHP